MRVYGCDGSVVAFFVWCCLCCLGQSRRSQRFDSVEKKAREREERERSQLETVEIHFTTITTQEQHVLGKRDARAKERSREHQPYMSEQVVKRDQMISLKSD